MGSSMHAQAAAKRQRGDAASTAIPAYMAVAVAANESLRYVGALSLPFAALSRPAASR